VPAIYPQREAADAGGLMSYVRPPDVPRREWQRVLALRRQLLAAA